MYSCKYHIVPQLELGFRVKWRSDNYVTFVKHLFNLSTHVRESKTVLDSGFHAVDSSPGIGFWMFCQWNWESGFQSLVGCLDSFSRIPNPKAKDSKFQSKNLLNSGFHKENFLEFRNPHSLTCGETSIPPPPRPSKNGPLYVSGKLPPTPPLRQYFALSGK